MSTTIPPTADELTPEQQELRERAAEFVQRVLRPLEQRAEAADGRLPDEVVDEIKREAIAARLHGGRVPASLGGQEWSMVEWFLVNEQFGCVTNGLSWHVPNVYNVWEAAT
ncbi:MAG: acyl-CoA dehydrogenase family protein, partial [Solirubrobacteraceae bacterium]